VKGGCGLETRLRGTGRLEEPKHEERGNKPRGVVVALAGLAQLTHPPPTSVVFFSYLGTRHTHTTKKKD